MPPSPPDPKRKFDAKVQFKAFSDQAGALEKIFARDRLDGPAVLRELTAAFIARFSHDRVQFPLVVDHGATRAGPPLVVQVPPEHRGDDSADGDGDKPKRPAARKGRRSPRSS